MNQRFYSLDVFRGSTVAFMILVNNPGNWSHIYSPFEHASWHGCTPTDIVFPFFLFAVGNSMAFVMPRLREAGIESFFKKVGNRTMLIFTIGFLLSWFPFFRWEDDQLVFKSIQGVRILGVLQRIALCYLTASTIVYFFKRKGVAIAAISLLLFYWMLCRLLGNPVDPYSLEGFWGTAIDRTILGAGHIYKGEGVPFDPEGLVSTISATVNVLIGYLVGQYIYAKEKTYEVVARLFVTGSLLIVLGFCLDLDFPINKKIWSSSFVLYTSGVATNFLAMLFYFVELHRYNGTLTRFFEPFGKNALFIFVLSGLFPRLIGLIRLKHDTDVNGAVTYISPLGWFYEHVCKPLFTNLNNGSLLYALCLVFMYWLIAYFLDKKRIYIRV